MNKLTIFANTSLFLFGLADCPVKPVDTNQNGIEKDWQNIGMDLTKAIKDYGQAK